MSLISNFDHDRNHRRSESESFAELADHVRALDPDRVENLQEWAWYFQAKALEEKREFEFIAKYGKPSRG